ncbi:hypothetical protein B0A53_04453 [Rhodotorula sp. CCFEE 5036]|nr:hypothetical protein B0A53_04453 [Rhodotorula sp. CCFEE 5036]
MTREVASPSSSGKVKVEASQNGSRTARNAFLEPDTGLGPCPTEQDPPRSDAPVVPTCKRSLRVLVLDCTSDAHLPAFFEYLSSHYPSDAPLPFDLVLGTGAAALPAVLVGRLGLAPNQAAAAREQVLLLLHHRDGTLPATSSARAQSKHRWAGWLRLRGGTEEPRGPLTPAPAPQPDRATALERALSTALPATREGFAHTPSDQIRPRTALLLQDADGGPSRSGWLCEETESGEDPPAAGVTITRAVAQTYFLSATDSAPEAFSNDAVAFANRIARDTPSILHLVAGKDGRFAANQEKPNVRTVFLDATERQSDNERASSSTDRAASGLAAPSVNGDVPLTGYGYGGPGAVTVSAEKKKKANLAVSLKEVCYRNLYANAKAFKVKYNKEVAVTDVKHANVFLFDGKMLDENSQEFYFEEFCYKQFKFKEHNADVKKESLGVVARRQLGGGIGGVGVGDVGVGVGSVSEAGSVGGFDGGVGAFDSGSFLNGFSGVDGVMDFAQLYKII